MTTYFPLAPTSLDSEAGLLDLAGRIAPEVFRTSLESPGFVLLDLGDHLAPRAFRALLVGLGQALDLDYQRRFGERLSFVSISRFDQQSPTRPHRDGGPDASILLLGYEPTEVVSRVSLLDYSRAASLRGLTPRELLACCNPAFGGDETLLHEHTTLAAPFTPGHYPILVVNNGNDADGKRGMLGVLHHAVIPQPRPDAPRFIDSVLMGVSPVALQESQLRSFVEEATPATV
jgi:hypothetical protein